MGLLFAEGGGFFVAAGDVLTFGAGEAVFSVVTDTLGSVVSVFSGVVASGDEAGVGLDVSSWASAKGAAARTSAVMAAIVIFILFGFRCGIVSTAPRERGKTSWCSETKPYFAARYDVKTHFPVQNNLASLVLYRLTPGVTLSASTRNMRLSNVRTLISSMAVAAIVVRATSLAPDPPAQIPILANVPISPTPAGPSLADPAALPVFDVRRSHIIDGCFRSETETGAPAIRGPNALISAALKQEWEIVRRLIDAGAAVETADETGLTALMVAAKQGNVEMLRTLLERQARPNFMDFEGRTALHYALAAGKLEAVELLLPLTSNLEAASGSRDLLTLALESGNMRIFAAVLERLPATLQWTSSTRRALEFALNADLKEQVRLLLSKHPAPPTREGGTVPLIAYAIAKDDPAMFRTLLACGSDPNIVIPKPADKEFMSLVKAKYLRMYIEGETGINLLMLAAGLGRTDYVRALLDAGADRNRSTPREKMLPLYFAAWTENWQCVQMLLGGGPEPAQLRVEISLKQQNAMVIKDGVTIFTTKVSTGRQGFTTPPGHYVITDKDRDHRSTIYKCAMPYFMRLNCRDFGMHEGVVQPYPASHGCIRLPSDAAKKLFVEIPVGTVVQIN